MILIGRYLSPFVRRVGVSLHHLDIPFEHQALSVLHEIPDVQRHNPLGRVPALVLDDGETLIDSAVILDHIDETVGPERALVPPAGAPRRNVLNLVALATGTLDRAMAAVAEGRRPDEQRNDERLERLVRQTRQGLGALENRLGRTGWFTKDGFSQADLTAVVAETFIRHMLPRAHDPAAHRHLAAIVGRCEEMPAFRAAPIDMD